MNPSPEETLRNVRNAYRLLHDYQRLVLDSVSFIGTSLGFDYDGGWHKFSDGAPRDGRGSLDLWAWDWLGLYCYEFHFQRKTPSGGRQRLSALHMPDTATLNVENKVDTSTFPATSASESKMAFIFLDGHEEWNFGPITEDPAARPLLAESGTLPDICREAGMQAKVFDMAQLFTEDQALQIIVELRAQFGIPAEDQQPPA